MATVKEREQFIAMISAEFPDKPQAAYWARLLMRHAKTHGRLEEDSCNGHPAQGSPTMSAAHVGKLQAAWDARIEKREAQVERRIREIAGYLGCPVEIGGDPRGYTIKLHLPSGKYNTFGGRESGWGVPQ